jgi:1-deoxy-D-xylulose-5-phosphate reductoisomerase
MSKKIAILGSTGSIGNNALRVIEALGEDYELAAITANTSVELLSQQIKKYRPKYAAIAEPSLRQRLSSLIKGCNTQIIDCDAPMEQIATMNDVDTVITAVVGAAGLGSAVAAAKNGKALAIANKEPLVIAGELLMKTARENNASVIPIDSEHSAIFQCLQAGNKPELQKIILTSSGGPFRTATKQQIRSATIEDALNHPTWDMGPKITVDSATMMNKALEVIEAKWLFDVPVDMIDVLIHPESVIHSLVEFVDGSVIAQLGTPDMCTPIQYALTFPERVRGITEHLNLSKLGSLNFHEPDYDIFRSLKLCFEVAKSEGAAAVVFNAANEQAVAAFLRGEIEFYQIMELVEEALNTHQTANPLSLEDLLEADKTARKHVDELVNRKKLYKISKNSTNMI